MKRFVLAVTMACALSGSALAGDIHSTGAPAPAPGDIHTTGAPAPAPTTQSSSVNATVILTILSLVR
jgi:hypothetical protein